MEKGYGIILGMDVGGTKSLAVLGNTRGEILGQGLGASGNINFVTIEQAEDSFAHAITEAQKQAGIKELGVEVAIIGIEPDPISLHSILKKAARPKKILHKKEGECSLVGGLVENTGISLIAGTGAVGWGRNRQGRTHVTGCWGTIGDEGSAYDLSRRGVNAAFWASDGRGQLTKLVDNLTKHFEVKTMWDCLTPIYQNPDVRKNFASLSRIVMQTAKEGDTVAIGVVKEGARQLALLLTTCAKVLDMQNEPYKIAATGGLVSKGGWYFDLIEEGVHKEHPQTKMFLPRFEPAVGAFLIGMQELGIEWTPEIVGNMENTLF